MKREVDTFIEGLQRDWYSRVKPKKNPEDTVRRSDDEPQATETTGPTPVEAADICRRNLRKRKAPVPGAMNEAIREGHTETKDAD